MQSRKTWEAQRWTQCDERYSAHTRWTQCVPHRQKTEEKLRGKPGARKGGGGARTLLSMKRGSGMKDHVERSRGMETLIPRLELWSNRQTLRLAKETTWRDRNWSDSSGRVIIYDDNLSCRCLSQAKRKILFFFYLFLKERPLPRVLWEI